MSRNPVPLFAKHAYSILPPFLGRLPTTIARCRSSTLAHAPNHFTPASSSTASNLPWNTIVKFVPQQQSWVIERFGKFSRVLEPGLAILIPVVETIAYVHTLKEVTVTIPSQSAITSDNVSLELDGVLYYRIVDPIKASYGIEHPNFAISQLAQTTMRAEIGRLTLDRMLAERFELNLHIVKAICSAAQAWGIECLRYEVRDIHLPDLVINSMHSQVSAERSKRATILESEGRSQAAINIAQGDKQAQILVSEAKQQAVLNLAKANAQSIVLHADANATAISNVSAAIDNSSKGADAISLQVAERWVDAWSGIAKNAGSVVVVPSEMGSASGMIAQAMSVFKSVSTPAAARIPDAESNHSALTTPPSTPSLDVKQLNTDIFEKTFKA